MSDKQLRFIFWFAFGYLFGNIVVWLLFAAYLKLTGRL